MVRGKPSTEDPALGLHRLLDDEGALVGERPAGLSDEELLRIYRAMRFQRLVDDRMLTLQRQGRIGFYGAATGQEAAVIASGAVFEPRDWIFPALREGGVALLRGYPFELYVAQLFGNRRDAVKGRQMPCHYSDPAHHYVSLSSPIATQLPQAVGAAHAAKLRKTGAVVVGYMGDGATSEGDFHVAMTFATVYRLPIVLFCANNQWAISVPWDRQTASATIAVKARAYGMEGVRVDGNDALAVWQVTKAAADKARRGDGPTFVEALTYRVGAHSTSDDPSRYRDESITEQWKRKDPIARLRRFVVDAGLWDEAREQAFVTEQEALIRRTVQEQEALPAPEVRTLFDDVYEEPLRLQREQRTELLRALAAAGPR